MKTLSGKFLVSGTATAQADDVRAFEEPHENHNIGKSSLPEETSPNIQTDSGHRKKGVGAENGTYRPEILRARGRTACPHPINSLRSRSVPSDPRTKQHETCLPYGWADHPLYTYSRAVGPRPSCAPQSTYRLVTPSRPNIAMPEKQGNYSRRKNCHGHSIGAKPHQLSHPIRVHTVPSELRPLPCSGKNCLCAAIFWQKKISVCAATPMADSQPSRFVSASFVTTHASMELLGCRGTVGRTILHTHKKGTSLPRYPTRVGPEGQNSLVLGPTSRPARQG